MTRLLYLHLVITILTPCLFDTTGLMESLVHEKLTCYIFIRRECGTLTIVGQGAYIGLPKAHNGGENGSPANDTITYIVSSSSETEMTLDIEVGGEL